MCKYCEGYEPEVLELWQTPEGKLFFKKKER